MSAFPELVDQLMSKVSGPEKKLSPQMEGALVRASPKDRSPFLLDHQELHKALVLVIGDDELVSVGAILNRPSAKGLDIQLTDKKTGAVKTVTIPLRFGGQYSVQHSQPLLWLHCSQALRQSRVGSPIGARQLNGIWKCTAEDVISAVGQGLAKPEDFIVVSGVSIWAKERSTARGIEGEIDLGNFEIIPTSQTEPVWSTLLKQKEVLTESNLNSVLALADEAWACVKGKAKQKKTSKSQNPIAGLGEGFDEEDDSLVFKSNMSVSKLSDDALHKWVATFLLGMPNC